MRDENRRSEVGTRREESARPPQAERKHPDEWAKDLNPDRLAGQNIGIPRGDLPNAYDLKDVHRSLRGFSDDELRQIPVIPEGDRLEQGGKYLDLNDAERGEFTATGEMSARRDERLVPKSDVPYPLWNRLRGIDDPDRTT